MFCPVILALIVLLFGRSSSSLSPCTECDITIISKLEEIKQLLNKETTDACPKACPDKWIKFMESCYLFPGQTMNFFDAQMFCQELGGRLVHIESHQENEFLKGQLRELHAGTSWMGLSDIVVENLWVWHGSGESLTVTDWHPGEPNNNKDQDCGVFWQQQAYRWGDNWCNELARPVCEM